MPDITITVDNKYSGLVTAMVYYTPKDGVAAGVATAGSDPVYCAKGVTKQVVSLPENADTTKPWTLAVYWGAAADPAALLLNRTFAYAHPKQTVCLGAYSTASRVAGGIFVALFFLLLIFLVYWLVSGSKSVADASAEANPRAFPSSAARRA